MSAPAITAAAQRIGRFELKRELGRGAQASVWLAHDPRLERDVALKLLHEAPGEHDLQSWLHEARAVSRVQHPNIVPVFEADLNEGRPYLVFEHVPGGTLSERLRTGPLPLREAVPMICGVLDALQAAHDTGVVHRDLKPSNILLDAQGRARVMDFGIAGRLDARGRGHASPFDGAVVGTPGYLSPEAARGERAAPSMDVFAAAIMLAEMLSGQALRPRERDPQKAVRRAADEDVALPASLGERADARLRGLLEHALKRDPRERTPSARAFREALLQWVESVDASAPPPAAVPAVVNGAAPGSAAAGTIEFLWRRMRRKSDFPALGDAVVRIHRVASSESESLGNLSNEILKDVALTQKLLRLVNSAQFAHAGGGTISTVSRAVQLVGFAGIRNLALSLVLMEHMQDKAHAQQLAEEFLRGLMAGTLAGELSPTARDAEEAFIGALFQNLGRLLAGFYLADEAAEVRAQAERIGETAAAVKVLGLDYQELGIGVARRWGLPKNLLQTMHRPDGDPPARRVEPPLDRQRWLACAANDMADALLRTDPAESLVQVESIAERYARALQLKPKEVAAAVDTARERMSRFVAGSAIVLPAVSPVRRLLTLTKPSAEATTAVPNAGGDKPAASDAVDLALTLPTPGRGNGASSPADASGDATVRIATPAAEAAAPDIVLDTVVVPPPAPARPDPGQAIQMLAAGIADITQSMVGDRSSLNQVLRMALETMYRALGFSRVLFCLRDPKTEALTGRFWLGDGADQLSAVFRVPLRPKPGTAPDLFAAICTRNADTLISDASRIADKLPAWYRAHRPAAAFLLLPLQMKQAPFALIYADQMQPGRLALGEQELNLLRTLRNQALMAFRQAS